MKSDLKERRNAAIVKRVNELLGQNRPIMDIYAQVGEEFWLEETTIRLIYNNKWTSHSFHHCTQGQEERQETCFVISGST